MRENIKYRIKEYCGEFTIQIYAYKEKGMLWWKRKEWSWYPTNAWGSVWQYSIIQQPLSKTFASIEEAQQQVKYWNTDPIYHKC